MQAQTHSQPTVYIVDDDQQMRESLHALLDVLHYRVRSFSTPGGFHRFYRPDMPGCLLLDLRMPRQNGLELYAQLLEEGKRLPVIFISAHADVTTAVAAMKSGAIEFLEKPFERGALVALVKSALQLDIKWREQAAKLKSMSALIGQLSDRERETLELIHRGATNKAMAAQLFVSERAVEMRRSAIMRKLQVSSTAELLDITISHRILSDLTNSRDHPLH